MQPLHHYLNMLLGCFLQGYLFRAAFLRRIPLFTRNLVENVLLCLVASGIESSAVRWLTSIELGWRDVLTARIHKSYFLNMVSLVMKHGVLRLKASMISGHMTDQIALAIAAALREAQSASGPLASQRLTILESCSLMKVQANLHDLQIVEVTMLQSTVLCTHKTILLATFQWFSRSADAQKSLSRQHSACMQALGGMHMALA